MSSRYSNNSNRRYAQNREISEYGQNSQNNGGESQGMTADKEVLMKSYDNLFMILKVLIGLFLIIGSIINRDYSFIVNNPGTFTAESISYGILGSIPLVFMEYNRKDPEKRNLIMIFIISFFIMVFFHVTLQLSGIYSYMYVDKDELSREYFKNIEQSDDKKNKHPNAENHENADKLQKNLANIPKNKSTKLLSGFNWTSHTFIALLILVFVGYSFYTSYKVMDFSIEKYDESGSKYLMFFAEIMLFSIVNSVPFFFIARNREANPKHLSEYEKELKEPGHLRTNLLETFLLFVKFFILHIILQLTGFYRHFFGPGHANIE